MKIFYNIKLRTIIYIVAFTAIASGAASNSSLAEQDQGDRSMWRLKWQPIVQIWDPDGDGHFESLPYNLLAVQLIDRTSGKLLVGKIEFEDGTTTVAETEILDKRIQTHGWNKGGQLFSSTNDALDLKLVLYADLSFSNAAFARPDHEVFPVDAVFHIAGTLILNDAVHTWIFPKYHHPLVEFNRLKSPMNQHALGFKAEINFSVAKGAIIPEQLSLAIDADADGVMERTITADPLTDEEHKALIISAQQETRELKEASAISVDEESTLTWDWLNPTPHGNNWNKISCAPNGDLYGVDHGRFVYRYHASTWQAHAGPFDEPLRFVTTPTPNDIYVANRRNVWHQSGSDWHNLNAPEDATIHAIAAWGDNQLVLVGSSTSILHHDKDGWRRYENPSGNELTAVWGNHPNDIWAVGRSGTILRFEGTEWSAVSSDIAANIRGIQGTTVGDIYILTDRAAEGLWRRSQTGTWQRVTNEGVRRDAFREIIGTDRSLYIRTRKGFYNYDGHDWSSVLFPVDFPFNSFCVGKSGEVVFAGDDGRIIRHDSGMWREDGIGIRADLADVWGLDSTEIFAAGRNGTIWRWDGTGLALMDSLPVPSLSSIWGTSPDDIHVAGSGQIWRFDGQKWSNTWNNPNLPPHKIWGASTDDAWAIVYGGTLLRWKNATWHPFDGVKTNELAAIWGSGPNDVYVGGRKTLLHFDGRSWQSVPDFHLKRVYSIWGSGPKNIYVATDHGLQQFNGEKWARLNLNTDETIKKVWGTGADEVLAVTSRTMLYFDGHGWQKIKRRDPSCSLELWGLPGSSEILSFGSGGNVLTMRR